MHDWELIRWSDALELLSEDFKNQQVRGFAVNILESSTNDEFHSFTMELVKALRFENKYPSSLSEFLKIRGCTNFTLFNWLFWYDF